jgi:hypothetical protein
MVKVMASAVEDFKRNNPTKKVNGCLYDPRTGEITIL